jgi:hypothetical protein
VLRDQIGIGSPFRLPIEIWGEISRRLPRSDLKTLLLVPHPIREVASQMFWQDISLRFDVYAKPDFEIWHIERSFGIMTRILRDPSFACRVRTLKIDTGTLSRRYAHPSGRPTETFEMGELPFAYIFIPGQKGLMHNDSPFVEDFT